ncbi:MAG TPA: molecular chaperone HtpG [Polyangiaceae bacterium]|jgi:molecular chaperone HtpG|nr:molecular chaperone HtpG [Polyangiaceae bacterium]
MSEPTTHSFKAEVSQVLHLVVNSLYSHKEVFLRELVSNASDALDKRRFEALTQPELGTTNELKIQISADAERSTLTISDNGIGMTRAELEQNLGTIARSGTREFVNKLSKAREAGDQGLQLIGQFGVGFYSAYLVADRVDVISRHAGEANAQRWSSDAQESFSIEPAERAEAGTSIVLHLKDDQKEFLSEGRLRELVRRYSDYIGHPIELEITAKAKDGATKEPSFERINQASALWQRSPSEVSAEQYAEFYRHLTHDYEPPLAHRHFKVEGTQLFAGLLFLPKHAPFDLYDPAAKHGIRLHVRRVFVMDDCAELLPNFLRFIRGVVDSEDLPLNVSREILQDSKLVRVIRKQVVNHSLAMIEELAGKDAAVFAKFWSDFGAVIKEGLHFESEHRDRIAKIVRYESSTETGLTTLGEYVSRMKSGQKAIYYATGTSRALLDSSPHLEALKKRGYEVLFMTDGVDPFAVASLGEFDGKKLVSAMDENLELGDEELSDEQRAAENEQKKQAEPLVERFKAVLASKVGEVRLSSRLTDSPVCLVVPEGGIAPHIERLMMARQMGLPAQKRILELNPAHPLIQNLERRDREDPGHVAEWIELLYDQALIAEGSPLENPAAFAQRLTTLLTSASAAG